MRESPLNRRLDGAKLAAVLAICAAAVGCAPWAGVGPPTMEIAGFPPTGPAGAYATGGGLIRLQDPRSSIGAGRVAARLPDGNAGRATPASDVQGIDTRWYLEAMAMEDLLPVVPAASAAIAASALDEFGAPDAAYVASVTAQAMWLLVPWMASPLSVPALTVYVPPGALLAPGAIPGPP